MDHGKSTLIAALTGAHPDRLKEEQIREMTIDLGFGWMTLPNGEEIGIVDVPGHRDFIENMLAGIGGIDAALLIIAADEGIMPQTREHLAILDLLRIPGGLIVLTKIDLASDPAWLDLVEIDIRAAVAGTQLQDAAMIRVSAKTGAGLGELITSLQGLLQQKPARRDLNRPRLPIDRVFSMSGFGTVVTGTLIDGTLAAGNEVEVLPSKLRGRIRGLQTHKKNEDVAAPGSRTAVNINGIDVESIRRGDVLTYPGQYEPTQRIDAFVQILKDASLPLKHNAGVKFFSAASETTATIRILNADEISPGGEGWVQLELRDPLVLAHKDRFILRRPSPAETLGGGMVVDAHPRGRHKRRSQTVIKTLAALAQGSPAEIMLEALCTLPFSNVEDLAKKTSLTPDSAQQALQELSAAGQVLLMEDGMICTSAQWLEFKERAMQIVDTYHKTYPLRRGIPRGELKNKLNLTPRAFNILIKKMLSEGLAREEKNAISQPGFKIHLNEQQQAKVEALKRGFSSSPYATPSIKECVAQVGEETFNALLESGEFIAVSAEVVFDAATYNDMRRLVMQTLEQNGRITLADVRDLFQTSRKYAQAFLEHLDSVGMTVREGDFRKIRE